MYIYILTPTERVHHAARRLAGRGAYISHVGHRSGVPRADVCVENEGLLERLRAEPNAVHADRKG